MFNAIINAIIGVKVNFSVICFRWLLVDHLTRLLTNIVALMYSSWSFSLHKLSERPWYQSSLVVSFCQAKSRQGVWKFCCSNKWKNSWKLLKLLFTQVWGLSVPSNHKMNSPKGNKWWLERVMALHKWCRAWGKWCLAGSFVRLCLCIMYPLRESNSWNTQ